MRPYRIQVYFPAACAKDWQQFANSVGCGHRSESSVAGGLLLKAMIAYQKEEEAAKTTGKGDRPSNSAVTSGLPGIEHSRPARSKKKGGAK